ncbi:hypothetical protein SBBP2_660011 [Burkholderiales bacterium]|jgi:hypothetical protein|nr:hypothetical protein SBBP2_660011 [Burkholderiales bacterium]
MQSFAGEFRALRSEPFIAGYSKFSDDWVRESKIAQAEQESHGLAVFTGLPAK